MDECEAVCKRTVIMLDGKLIYMGSPEELKQRFGAGYDVQIRMDSRKSSTQTDKIKKDMRSLLHCVLNNENSVNFLNFMMTEVIYNTNKLLEYCISELLDVLRCRCWYDLEKNL